MGMVILTNMRFNENMMIHNNFSHSDNIKIIFIMVFNI
jgi:hypothetical protein